MEGNCTAVPTAPLPPRVPGPTQGAKVQGVTRPPRSRRERLCREKPTVPRWHRGGFPRMCVVGPIATCSTAQCISGGAQLPPAHPNPSPTTCMRSGCGNMSCPHRALLGVGPPHPCERSTAAPRGAIFKGSQTSVGRRGCAVQAQRCWGDKGCVRQGH